ncbi:hypothetical protein GX51_02437 [Blastomyces parvus]|uniref:Uncharacterized protein n=1 Tax=Blastomyces parvus TaxID=2060905 RepID=A0A2B7XBS7_9EURO|nr:hypothetical protein GX51_02437 [Blastomyces parvus]
MSSSARFSSRPALRHPIFSVSPRSHPHLLPLANSSTSDTYRSPGGLHPRQQRALFWWSRHHDPEWLSQGKSRLRKLMEKEKEMQALCNKYVTRVRRRRPYIYQNWRSTKSHDPKQANLFYRRCDVYDDLGQGMKQRNEGGKHWVANEGERKNGFEDLQSPGEKNGFDSWESKESEFGDSLRRESEQHFKEFQKAINQDPYGFIFGRRLQPFPFGLKEGSWSSFYKSLFPGERPTSGGPRTSYSEDDTRKAPINVGTEPAPMTSSEMNINGDHSRPSNPMTEAAFEFDPISGRMVPTRTKTTESEIDDASPIILSNPRDGEAKVEPDYEQYNSKPTPNISTEEPVPIEPELQPSSETISPNRTTDQAHSKPAQNIDAEQPGAVKAKQSESIQISATENATTETPQTSVGERFDTDGSAVKSSQHDLGKAALRDDTKDDLKPDVRAPQDPEKPVENKGHIPKELQGMSISELLQHLESVELPNVPPVCEVYQRAYDVSERSGPKDDVDQLRASDIRASYMNRTERQNAVEKAYEALQGEDCGLDVDELRWKLGPDNNGTRNAETVQDLVSNATQPTDPVLKAVNSLFDNVGTRGKKPGKVTYIRNIGSVDDISTAVGDSKHDEVHPVFGVRAADAKRHSEIGSVARELREIKGATNSMKALLTEQHSPLEATADCGSENDNAAASSKMMHAIEEREKLIAHIGETLSDVKNINTSIASLLTELGKINSIREEDAKKSRLVKNVSEEHRSSRPNPSQYRVLAYDSLTMEVKDVGISSGHTGSGEIAQQLHPTEALSRLNHPSRFLDHFPRLEAQGYEIVSGGGDILIFKRVRGRESEDVSGNFKTAIPDATAAKKSDSESDAAYADGDAMLHSPAWAAQLEKEAIDQFESGMVETPVRLSSETQRGATPAGQEASSSVSDEVNQPIYDSEETKHQQQQQQQRDSSSQPPPPHPEKRRPFLRKTLRRVLLTGGVAAGTCYAFGVVAEYFRAGGQDGLGPQGFTGLEGR